MRCSSVIHRDQNPASACATKASNPSSQSTLRDKAVQRVWRDPGRNRKGCLTSCTFNSGLLQYGLLLFQAVQPYPLLSAATNVFRSSCPLDTGVGTRLAMEAARTCLHWGGTSHEATSSSPGAALSLELSRSISLRRRSS